MSDTEPSPSSVPGKRGNQLFQDLVKDPPPPTDLPETELDPTKGNQERTEMDTKTEPGSQPPVDLSNTTVGLTAAAQSSSAVPSHSDSLAAQMVGLAVSENNISEDKPTSEASTPPPPPPAKDYKLLDSNLAPAAPFQSTSEANSAPSSEKELPDVPGNGEPESRQDGHTDRPREENESQLEIQSIMGQFQDPARTTGQQEIMSPRMELADQFRGTQNYFPPRRSSLEPIQPTTIGTSSATQSGGHSVAAADQHHHKATGPDDHRSTRQSSASTVPPPPEPESNQPFDFHRFLEQLRHRTADPVAKFLRSFLMEFGKRQWMVHEQVKIISDFLAFITNKMAQCEVWRDVSDSEFDNAKEGMEKLVMNRLYSQTFAPAIPAPPTIPRSASRSRRREIERLHGPWRRGQHQEDIERDDILAQKIRIYSWVNEEHLDIPPVSGGGRRFLNLAQQGMS